MHRFFLSLNYNIQNREKEMKNSWHEDEEKLLLQLIQAYSDDWHQISENMNKIFTAKIRTPKQCRQRYNDYLRFSGNKSPTKNWGEAQINIFLAKIWEFGISWIKIRDSLAQENISLNIGSNSLKNYFYSSLKIAMNKINRTLNLYKKDCIKQTPFRRFISVGFKQIFQIDSDSFFDSIFRDLITRCLKRTGEWTTEEAKCIYGEINRFNKKNRHLNARKLLSSKGEKIKNLIMPSFEEENKDSTENMSKPVSQSLVMDEQQSLEVCEGGISEESDRIEGSQNRFDEEKSFEGQYLNMMKSPQEIFIDSILSL